MADLIQSLNNRFVHVFTACVLSSLLLLSPAGKPRQSIAQNPLQPLMRPNQTLALPNSVAAVKTTLGRSYAVFEKEDFDKNPGGWGNRYVWQFANGLTLTAQSDGQTATPVEADSVRAFFLTAPRGRAVPALAGFVLHKTTKSTCQTCFGSAMQPSRGALLTGKRAYRISKKDQYTYLIFDAKGILTAVWQTTVDLETAG